MMLATAHQFRLKITGEGVETAAQVDYLRCIGCEYAQGFYYSLLLPPQAALEHIELGPRDAVAIAPH